MGIGIERILQVKIPVADLQCSVGYYRRVFDLHVGWDLVEDGDGTVTRFLTPLGEHAKFLGPEFHADGPRLRLD